jgi:hypothetical protein
MAIPKNVRWFEALLYVALSLDAVSVVFQDRAAGLTQQTIMISTISAACLILLQFYFVWLAAQRRKSWPRWALAVALVLAVISLAEVIGGEGVLLSSAIEMMSCAATRKAGSTIDVARRLAARLCCRIWLAVVRTGRRPGSMT